MIWEGKTNGAGHMTSAKYVKKSQIFIDVFVYFNPSIKLRFAPQRDGKATFYNRKQLEIKWYRAWVDNVPKIEQDVMI